MIEMNLQTWIDIVHPNLAGVDHWTKDGITTVEQLEDYLEWCDLYELYYEINHYKPRSWTLETLRSWWTREEQYQESRRQEEESIRNYRWKNPEVRNNPLESLRELL